MLKFLLRLFSPPKLPPRKFIKRKGSSYSRSRVPPPRPVSKQRMPPTLSGVDDLKGKCYVIDGDTISIGGTHIRLAGIDAPELDQPWGKKAKFAMVALCKGQIITAEVQEGLSYNRLVAKCTLSDGTDLSAALVEQGLALDWSKFSGGAYRHLEPQGTRKKLWRVAAKHKGKLRIEN
nr:thermonuclease family protein [Amylibacter sp.]